MIIYLGHNDVAVQTSVEPLRVSLDTHLKRNMGFTHFIWQVY